MPIRPYPAAERPPSIETGPRRVVGSFWDLLLVTTLMTPALSAAWLVPGFVTQDGPCHLYNSWIIARSLAPGSPYESYYEVRWQPLPNWAGHLATAGLLQLVSPWIADRILITLTALGPALAFSWLRRTVRGVEAPTAAILLSAILGINFLWLMGFTSFLLGCVLFGVTLGVWWEGRDGLSAWRMISISTLLLLGYFAHLVSLGLTVVALGLLAVLTAPSSGTGIRVRAGRVLRTALCGVPLLAPAAFYLRLSRTGGPMRPSWETLDDPASPASWLARVGWVNPVSICRKSAIPFSEATDRLGVIFAPDVWLLIAGGFLVLGLILGRIKERRGGQPDRVGSRRLEWLILGLVLLAASMLGPDSFGEAHGGYLPQRICLLGLGALVPWIQFRSKSRTGSLAIGAMAAALLLQTVQVWDYALYSERTAGEVIRAGELVGREQRVATLLINIRSRFRANPLLHVDSWLGVGTGNILWSNYEAQHYYFPVRFRTGLDHPDPRRFELLANGTDPAPTAGSVRDWERLLASHGPSIDRVLAWGHDAALDAITARWGERVGERGVVSVYARRK